MPDNTIRDIILKTFSNLFRYIDRSTKEVEEIDAKTNFIRLVSQYQNLVFSVCLKLTGDYFTSEDIAQDTFIAAYQHWEEFDGNNEKAWLCRIASNKCMDYLRRAERKNISYESEDMSELGDTKSDPQNMYAGKAVVEEVRAACEKLPEPYRYAAQDYFVEGCTAKQISDRTGIHVKTVQTRIHRAREMLKKTVRKEDLFP